MNKRTQNNRVHKKRKTKKYDRKKISMNKDIRIYRDIYSFEQEAGGLFDILKKSKLKTRIKNFIKKNNIVKSVLDNFISNENKKFLNIDLLERYIRNFLFLIFKKLYFLLKERKNNILFKGSEGGKYENYKYKYLYKYESNTLKNNKLLNIIKSFITLLFASKNTIYPLSTNLYYYSNPNNNITKYFDNHIIDKVSIKDYIKAILQYDDDMHQKNRNAKLYLKNLDNQLPRIKYKEIQYIKSMENTGVGNNNIANTNKDKVFLIIYKDFSRSQQNNNSFKYTEDISENDFYILENNFVKIKNGISNYFKNMLSSNLTKKKTKYLIEDINKFFFNKKYVDNYANFLLYYYKSQIFIE